MVWIAGRLQLCPLTFKLSLKFNMGLTLPYWIIVLIMLFRRFLTFCSCEFDVDDTGSINYGKFTAATIPLNKLQMTYTSYSEYPSIFKP
jgi:hypothetical protein